MKTRTLIIIGIVVIIGVSISLITAITYEQFTNRNTSSHFDYKDTRPVIQDTYLDKTISEWQNESDDSLMSYHSIHGDVFFEQLGSLVIKNEMLNELNKQNIQVSNPDFKVYPGMVLLSLPPHVSFEAFVNDTSDNTYRLSSMTNKAKVNPVHITKLQFFDTRVKLPLESILSQNNTIIIKQQNGNEHLVIPYNLVIYGNKDIVVNFQNTLLVPIRIQSDDGDWKNPNWYGPTILPLTAASMTFDKPGLYEWHSRTLPAPGSVASDHIGNGQINIISDNMDDLTFQDKQKIGAAILQNSEIPWSGMGSGSQGITIEFNRGILDAIPDARDYYQARAEQLIPFDIPIIIEDPYRNE